MPELPEVETVRIGLSSLLPGKAVQAVSFDNQKSFPNAAGDVNAFLVGAKVLGVKRRAKVLLIELSSQYSLVIHLKMTGQMVFVGQKSEDGRWKIEDGEAQNLKDKTPPSTFHLPTSKDEVRFGAGHPNDSLIGKLPDKSTRVVLHIGEGKDDALEPGTRKQRSAEEAVGKLQSVSTGAADNVTGQERWRSFGLSPKAGQCAAHLFFNDQRKFGWMKLIPTAEVPNIDFMKKVGPEPLEASFTAEQFAERLQRRKNTSVKAALLDQTVIAGIGNIYADESLWGAKIHPSTLVKDIPKSKVKTLYTEVRYVLNLAIEKGGSSDRNYVNAEGKKGSYLSFARVFRREGQACPRCGTTIEKSRVAGRGTHTCPHCQKLKKGK